MKQGQIGGIILKRPRRKCGTKYKAGIILLNEDERSCSDGLDMLVSAAHGDYPAAKYLLSMKELCTQVILNDYEGFDLYKERFINDVEYIKNQQYASEHGVKNAKLQLAKLHWNCYRAGEIEIDLCKIPSLIYFWLATIIY